MWVCRFQRKRDALRPFLRWRYMFHLPLATCHTMAAVYLGMGHVAAASASCAIGFCRLCFVFVLRRILAQCRWPITANGATVLRGIGTGVLTEPPPPHPSNADHLGTSSTDLLVVRQPEHRSLQIIKPLHSTFSES